MLCPVIDNHTSCEIQAVILILHTKNTSAVVYGQNVMSEEL
jgi:hypothetical protein